MGKRPAYLGCGMESVCVCHTLSLVNLSASGLPVPILVEERGGWEGGGEGGRGTPAAAFVLSARSKNLGGQQRPQRLLLLLLLLLKRGALGLQKSHKKEYLNCVC